MSAKRKPVQPAKPRGQPSVYTNAIAEEICARLASGESLNAICKSAGMPGETTVRRWAVEDHEGFAAKYTHARDLGWEHHADEILRLADECRLGRKTTTKDGKVETVDGDMVERSRLQIDARKWLLAKMLPHRYGKQQSAQPSAGVVNNTLMLFPPTAKTMEEFSENAAKIMTEQAKRALALRQEIEGDGSR